MRVLRDIAKRGMFRSFHLLGVSALLHARMKDKVLILNYYHGVLTEDHSLDRFRYHNTVSLAEFERHLQTVRRYFTPVSVHDLKIWMRGGKPLPPYPALVTLDDGYRNDLTHAAPLLKKYQVPAVIFLTTGYVGDQRLLWLEEIVQRAGFVSCY